MQPHSSQRVRELFYQAIQCPPEGRTNWIDSLDTDDRALVAEVESLLASFDDAGEFLAEPPPASPALREPAGTQIGHFVIRRHIGEGGFGDIYLAEQNEPVCRRVALKIIKPGMDSREVLRRFRAERQTLAMLEHPNIARIIDAGATPAGRPYFVMELVEGPRITRYCDEHRLPVARRIELFLFVCDAVQHAHQRGVIHRDLKPANVLVSEMDGKLTPKVIDFGIAKVLRPEQAQDNTLMTVKPHSLGTPVYMSPEQMRGESVDTRTDVYSLGIMIYELLCGRLPFDKHERDREAPPMTRRLAESDGASPDLAAARSTTATALRRTLRGELEWIVARCLQSEREERYPTVNALVEDLRAHLAGQPVSAAPPSRSYRVRKFAARHRVGVVSLVLAALGLLAVSAGMTWLAVRATRAERLAQRRLEDADAVNQFLTIDMIGSADPAVTRGNRELTVRQALDKAAEALATKFKARPLTEAVVRDSVATAYLNLGHADLALPHARQVLELRLRLLGEEHFETLVALNNYGSVLEKQGRFADAEALFKQALDTSRRTLGEDHFLTSDALHNYASALSSLGRSTEAEPLLRRAWEQTRRLQGEDHPDTLMSLNRYAGVLDELGRHAESEPLYREALERHRRVKGEDHPRTIMFLNSYALVLKELGRYGEAEPLQKEGLDKSRRVLGDDHIDTLVSMNNYATLLRALGRIAESEPYSRQTMEGFRREFGEDHLYAMAAVSNYAEVLRLLGRKVEAESVARQVLENHRRVMGEDHPNTIALLNKYAQTLEALDRHADAEPLHKEALRRSRRVRSQDHPDTLFALSNYGSVLKSLGRDADAEPIFAELYEKAGRAQVPPADAAHFMANYGPCLARLERYEQAEAPLREAYRRLRETNQSAIPRMPEVLEALAQVCDHINRPDEAARWRAELRALTSRPPTTQPSTRPA